MKLIISGIALYAAMMIFTFGHAFNGIPDTEVSKYAGIEYTIHNGSGVKAMMSFVSGIFWPLYWSVELQETK